jgi:hypothetical protein
MTIGSSLLLIAVGAILMVVGGVGLCIGLFLLFRVRWSAGPRPGPQ